MNDPEVGSNMENKCPQCGAPLPAGGLAGLCPACLLAQGAADTATQPETPPFQPPPVEEMARLFPTLEILGLIGKGGMGAVYKARQPVLDRIVALKILPAQVNGGPDFTERFNREARALARLNHPNIVTVHEFGQVSGMPFFIMEYVDGLNLRQLERAGRLSPREALQIVPQICEALQFAHDTGVVHRDIKPDNILVDQKGRVKIADFGIAKILGGPPATGAAETRGVIGTPHYMAPEQVEKPQSVDHRADIFSLGVVFYEMLTGELPLGKFAPPSASPHAVQVDVRLDEVVLRALEKEPDRRYQHASQVKTAVETIASTPGGAGGSGGQIPPGPGGPGAPPPPAGPSPEEILARDYTLDIGRCFERGWALFRAHFWPLVGLTALVLVLQGVADSLFTHVITVGTGTDQQSTVTEGASIGTLLLWGPLYGGLAMFFLKKIRGEAATVEVAFSGFSRRFLHLFLANFVVGAVVGIVFLIGLMCCCVPCLLAVYPWVIWNFAVVLVMDKGLDFWAAMELSRKMVNKHWVEVLVFLLLAWVLWHVGYLACCVGVFLTAPLAIAAELYAYEDIFCPVLPAAPAAGGPLPPPPAAGNGPTNPPGPASADRPPGVSGASGAPGPIGPTGTVVLPAGSVNPPPGGAAAGVPPPGPIGPGQPPTAGGGNNRGLIYVLIAVGGALLLLLLGVLFFFFGLPLLAVLASFLFAGSMIHRMAGPGMLGFPPFTGSSRGLFLGGWEIVLIIGAMALVVGLMAVILFILIRKSKPATATPGRLPASAPGTAAGRAGAAAKPGFGGTNRFLHYALLLVGGGCLILIGICLLTSVWSLFIVPGAVLRAGVPVLTIAGLILVTGVAITAVILGGRGVFRSRTAPTSGVLKSLFKILLLLLTGLLTLLLGVVLVISYFKHYRSQPWNVSYVSPAATAVLNVSPPVTVGGPGYAYPAFSLGTNTPSRPSMPAVPTIPPMPTMPSMPTMPPTMPVPTPPQPGPSAPVTLNDNDAFVARVRQELGRGSVRFDKLIVQGSATGSGNIDYLAVQLTGLQKLGLVDGTNAWTNIVGSLGGTARRMGTWDFKGQDQLAGVQFIVAKLNLNQMLSTTSQLKDLAARLEAVVSISDSSVRDQAAAALARDAATVGDFRDVQSALGQIYDSSQRNAAAHDAALLLAKAGLRKEAVQIALGINEGSVRDRTLSELAQ